MENKETIVEGYTISSKLTKALADYEKAVAIHQKTLKRCEQLEHKVTLLENRIEYQKKQERKRRTHRLCTRAGYIESLLPETKELTDNQFMALCDALFSYPKVKALITKLLIKVKEEN